MGQLLTFLAGNQIEDVFIDFENARPTPFEQPIYDKVSAVMAKAHVHLDALTNYKGCQDMAKKAMTDKSFEEEAFVALSKPVQSVYDFFRFSQELAAVFPELLQQLAAKNDNDNNNGGNGGGAEDEEKNQSSLEGQQALARLLADVLKFVLEFDTVRMLRPHIANDFSFYRRLLPKFSKHPSMTVNEVQVHEMAMFTGFHVPMLFAVRDSASNAAMNSPEIKVPLTVMANACLSMLRGQKTTSDDTRKLCMYAMTCSIVIYDHIDRQGAFHKKSPIYIKQCLQELKAAESKDPSVGGLLNAIKYSSVHSKDAPDGIYKLLFE